MNEEMVFNPLTGEFDMVRNQEGASSSVKVITYPFPATRDIELNPDAFTIIWNVNVPARSEVTARVAINLGVSSEIGYMVALGFLANAENIAASAAPLPAVSSVEHSLFLTHWFEKETSLAVVVHSTTKAVVTDMISPALARMAGASELIIKTFG